MEILFIAYPIGREQYPQSRRDNRPTIREMFNVLSIPSGQE